MFRIPIIQILAPVNPDGIGIFLSLLKTNMVGKQEPESLKTE